MTLQVGCFKKSSLPFLTGIGRQRWRGFGAVAHVIGETAILFLRINIVPAAKRVDGDLLESAEPEVAYVVKSKESIKKAAKSVGRETVVKQLVSGSGKMSASRVIPKKSAKELVGREQSFLQTFLIHRAD